MFWVLLSVSDEICGLKEIALNTSPDNIFVDPYTADLYVGCHPVKSRLFRHESAPKSIYTPSQVSQNQRNRSQATLTTKLKTKPVAHNCIAYRIRSPKTCKWQIASNITPWGYIMRPAVGFDVTVLAREILMISVVHKNVSYWRVTRCFLWTPKAIRLWERWLWARTGTPTQVFCIPGRYAKLQA